MEWYDYRAGRERHSVVGNVLISRGVWSSQLHNQRDILVYLPRSYGYDDRRYPVIYMQDGQNIFDEVTSYCGEWYADETMEALSGEGVEAILVGIPNMGRERIREYAPFTQGRWGPGRGNDYLRWIVETLKPTIDHDFRTRPEREATGLLGSSMGGLISLYGFFQYHHTFGLGGAMSPSLWFARHELFSFIESSPFFPGSRLYLDVGTQEASGQRGGRSMAKAFRDDVRRAYELLAARPFLKDQLCYVEAKGAKHHESEWARRLPNALRFLLQQTTR